MKKYGKILLIGLLVTVALIIILFFYKCPFKLIFHFACPGCGFTRAVKYALSFNFKDAFVIYPAWLLLCLEGCYLVFRVVFRNRFNFNKNAESVAFWMTVAIMMLQYFIKLYFGVLPN